MSNNVQKTIENILLLFINLFPFFLAEKINNQFTIKGYSFKIIFFSKDNQTVILTRSVNEQAMLERSIYTTRLKNKSY